MMPQVRDIILCESAKRDRVVIPDATGHAGSGIWDSTHNMREMMVVENPEVDQVKPRSRLISLRAHPAVLLVSWEGQLARELGPHEPLMIVCRRINEMPDDLFDGPHVRCRLRGGDGLVDPPQFGRRSIDDASQFSRD